MEQLFLIEILVDTISFDVQPAPQKKQIYIIARFNKIANLEFRYDGITTGDESTKQSDVDFSTGKSYLFPCKADDLLAALRKDPLEMTVGTKTSPRPFGKATFVWTQDFIEMLESCGEGVGYITPTSIRNVFPLLDNGEAAGHIDAFVRLSCFGKSIQTQFQILQNKDTKDGTPKTQYLFKSTNAATTFQCERYGLGTSADILPVAPVFNPIEFEDGKGLRYVYRATSASVCGSVVPSVFDLDLENVPALLNQTGTEEMLIERPPNAKFTKLEDIEEDKKIYTDAELTPENINRLLCHHRDCPAAKKFKEFGIGPLATGKGLGTLYGTVEPPTTYGMSHAHGNMDRYGPYGVYRRPKRVDQQFVKKTSSSSAKESTSEKSQETTSSKSSTCGCHSPLRLSGGAPMEDSDTPSPFLACKDLMADFDKVLLAYKKALGPCGHASCPFSENVIAQSCKLVCPGGDTDHAFPLTPAEIVAQSMVCPDKDDISTCGIPSCPYTRKITQPVEEEFKLGQIKSACGDPTCPYVKQRCQLQDEDADEATVMLATLPKTCGAAKCPYVPEPVLPPIHWDCPDPLPKGLCKNPNCPISKKEQLAACIFQPPMSPCCMPTCPYAVPPPCNFPGCPFGPPMPCTIPGCPYSIAPICTDPDCPLNAPDCDSPTCPFTQKRRKGSTSTLCDDSTCQNLRKKGTDAEVSSGDAMQPCAPNAGKSKGAELQCVVCGRSKKKNVCPCFGKSKKRDDGDEEGQGEGAIEICSGDTMEPCTPYTCKAKGGDLVCAICKSKKKGVCPCATDGEKDSDNSEGSGDIEVCSGDTMQPCTPYTCKSRKGDLECDICGEGDDGDAGDFDVVVEIGDRTEPCSPNTCRAKGGDLVCDECALAKAKGKSGATKAGSPCPCTSPDICAGDSLPAKPGKRRKSDQPDATKSPPIIEKFVRNAPHKPLSPEKTIMQTINRSKKRSRFVYDTGDVYPGVKIGHRNCVIPRSNVPHNMGWLWNIKPPGRLKPRRGWKPGALTKSMAETIIKHRLDSGIKPLIGAPPVTKGKKKSRKMNAYGVYESDSENESIAPKPTLQIKKKDGCYMITMNPLKDPYSLEENENPYMDCTPLQFKISKKVPPVRIREEEGEDSSCCCLDDKSTSSDSELDIEFTPPAGILHPEKLKKKKNVIHTDTQYCLSDLPIPDKTLQLEKKGSKADKKGKKGKGKKGKGKKGKKGKKK